MLRRIGWIILAIGAIAALAGLLLQLVAPGPDANIGAGLLVVLGLPVLGVGIVVVLVATLLRRARDAHR